MKFQKSFEEGISIHNHRRLTECPKEPANFASGTMRPRAKTTGEGIVTRLSGKILSFSDICHVPIREFVFYCINKKTAKTIKNHRRTNTKVHSK
jgi:hypothetical protein